MPTWTRAPTARSPVRSLARRRRRPPRAASRRTPLGGTIGRRPTTATAPRPASAACVPVTSCEQQLRLPALHAVGPVAIESASVSAARSSRPRRSHLGRDRSQGREIGEVTTRRHARATAGGAARSTSRRRPSRRSPCRRATLGHDHARLGVVTGDPLPRSWSSAPTSRRSGRATSRASSPACTTASSRCRSTVKRWNALRCGRLRTSSHSGRSRHQAVRRASRRRGPRRRAPSSEMKASRAGSVPRFVRGAAPRRRAVRSAPAIGDPEVGGLRGGRRSKLDRPLATRRCASAISPSRTTMPGRHREVTPGRRRPAGPASHEPAPPARRRPLPRDRAAGRRTGPSARRRRDAELSATRPGAGAAAGRSSRRGRCSSTRTSAAVDRGASRVVGRVDDRGAPSSARSAATSRRPPVPP